MRIDIKEIDDKADMIFNWYSFTKYGEYVRVLNLDYLNHAAVILNDRVVETNMDDIETQIALDYYEKNKRFMEV